ncbi:acyltransferase [Facklamia sp. DSM 111018]|uniref:Acyltransferase n=1 Tax=Facklamia lactis TaxID=2749967 RepID=A0ABS0LMI0_9LACT|nr:acyltransferase [Facklamia lactis]MBG9979949.1 acyltransferase [Facklamia lactis]MBG9985371.1 acyltransferase [Facklamia lactis]
MVIIRAIKKVFEFIYFYIDPIKYARYKGVKVGERSSIMSWRFGSEPWLISIGNHVRITSNVRFITHDGGSWVFREDDKYKDVKKFGKIEIKDNCFIGNNVILMPDISIGPNAVIGAGAVVTKDVPANTVVAGVPAKPIMSIEEYAEKSLQNTPPYDKNNYRENRQEEILKYINWDSEND